jgi:hypothetical protein
LRINNLISIKRDGAPGGNGGPCVGNGGTGGNGYNTGGNGGAGGKGCKGLKGKQIVSNISCITIIKLKLNLWSFFKLSLKLFYQFF